MPLHGRVQKDLRLVKVSKCGPGQCDGGEPLAKCHLELRMAESVDFEK